jgi:hypothetical protein
MANNVIHAKDTLGQLFHKEFRMVAPQVADADDDVFYEILARHNIEVMPEDAGPAAFYEVGFGDGFVASDGPGADNTYVIHNKAEFEYLFVRAGNLRGVRGRINAACRDLRKLLK